MIAFKLLSPNRKNVIVELGTSRSFVDSKYTGCMVPDKRYWEESKIEQWDWGAGLFTRICSEMIFGTNSILYSVDPLARAIYISRIITNRFNNNIVYERIDSTSFLQNMNKTIDLLYMDHHETCEEGAKLHLKDCEIFTSKNLLRIGSVIIIDDTGFSDFGKGKYSIPFLQNKGFRIIYKGYQTVLIKDKN